MSISYKVKNSITLMWSNIMNPVYRVLTDIMGMEDFLGDMDFKFAATRYTVSVWLCPLFLSLSLTLWIYIYIYLSITLSLPFLHFISLGLSILLFISVYLSRVGIGVACAIFTARQGCRIKSLRIHLKFLKSWTTFIYTHTLSLSLFRSKNACLCLGPEL